MTERILSEVLELDVDRCANTYGVSPCTAGRVETGTAQAGSANTLQLRAGASAVDDAFNGMTARLKTGSGSVQERRIVDYNGTTKVATVEPWGLSGHALDFNGTTQYVTITDHASLKFGAGAFTLEATINADAVQHLGGNFPAILDKGTGDWTSGTGQLGWRLGETNGTNNWTFRLNDGTATSPITVAFGSLSGAGIKHLVVTVDALADPSPTLRGYIDGVEVSSVSRGTKGSTDNAVALEIGRWRQFAREFAGVIDGVRIYSRALSATEAAEHFQNIFNDETGLVGRWDFDEGAGSTAADRSGNGNNGTLVNAPTWTDPLTITLPDATTTYEIIDRANACYKTYRTCQDKANYVKGVQTIRFTGRGAPIDPSAPARPYITAIETAPTELDLEECVSRRASSTVSLVDAPDSDVEMDPYVRDRATPAGGTFWRRFFARNLAYSGRPARIKRAFVTSGVFGAWTTERFILDKATGPSGSGEVRLTLKDPIKLLDRATVPLPTSGKLALPLGLNDLSLTLGSGEGAQYAATGRVRINDEVIRYSGKVGDVLSWPDGTYRAQFGTAAAAHDIDDGVQQCYVVEDAAFSEVVEELHNLGGIDSGDLDLAGLASEESTWLASDFRISNVCISDPEDLPALLKELMQPAGMVTWWSPIDQEVKFKVVAPASPAAITLTVLDDTAELMDGSVSLAREEDLRITLAAVNFARVSAIAEQDEAKSYRRTEIAVDLDAESANEYNERRVLQISSRFYGPDNTRAMRTFVARYVARHRDAPERIEFLLDPKDGAHKEGDLVDVQTYSLVDEAGQIRTARVLITRRQSMGTQVKYAGRITTFDRPYAFIAPNGTPDYPNANGYACISQNDGLMTNGDPGYLII